MSGHCRRHFRSEPGRSIFAIKCIGLVTLFALTAPARSEPSDCVIEPSLVVKLGSPVTSVLSEVQVERGDEVTVGQVIARVESSVERAAVDYTRAKAESTAEIEAKQAILEQKRGIMSRKRGLQKSSIVSSQDSETAEAEFNVAGQELSLAKLNKRMAEIELGRTQAQLDQRTIRSPIDGIVTRRTLGPGEFVNPEANIATIARVNPLNVETYLSVKTFGQIKVGQIAVIRPNEPIGGEYRAKVIVVDQIFDAASGTYGVRLQLDNPGNRIPAGLRCKVDLTAAP